MLSPGVLSKTIDNQWWTPKTHFAIALKKCLLCIWTYSEYFFSCFLFIEICTISWIFGRLITSIIDIIPHTFITFMNSSKTNYILQGRKIPASLLYFSECVGSRVSLHLSLSANISNKKSDKAVLSKDTEETFTMWRLIRVIRTLPSYKSTSHKEWHLLPLRAHL